MSNGDQREDKSAHIFTTGVSFCTIIICLTQCPITTKGFVGPEQRTAGPLDGREARVAVKGMPLKAVVSREWQRHLNTEGSWLGD